MADADPSSIRDFHAGGLPAVNLAGLRGLDSLSRPWWAGLAPPLAVRATEGSIQERLGRAITDAVEFDDRNLEWWLNAKLVRLVQLYETQAGAFREQLRRLAATTADAGTAGGDGDLEVDLRELREAEADGGVAAGQPDVVATT
ncbi:MAG TPA: hypothetical protein VFF52_04795 [Isosphaeraceae bacterium]|nr:hypothetical protein [Isosphaeraceae bacterium]